TGGGVCARRSTLDPPVPDVSSRSEPGLHRLGAETSPARGLARFVRARARRAPPARHGDRRTLRGAALVVHGRYSRRGAGDGSRARTDPDARRGSDVPRRARLRRRRATHGTYSSRRVTRALEPAPGKRRRLYALLRPLRAERRRAHPGATSARELTPLRP